MKTQQNMCWTPPHTNNVLLALKDKKKPRQ